MKSSMQNLTVRFSLMGALCLFAFMILLGAGVGVYTLDRANQSTILVHEIASQAAAINDAYKDTTRTRSAMTRAYSALKEQNDLEVRNSALKNAQSSYERTLKKLTEFQATPSFPGEDEVLKTGLVDDGRRLSEALSKAMDALRAGDTAAYAAINGKDITASGAAFSAGLEKFQKLANDLADDTLDQREREYKQVIWLVLGGLVVALALVVAVHFLLKFIVIAPLNRAVSLLERVARGDLTMRIENAGNNEIGQLLAAISNMQQGLENTVSRVRSSSDVINTGAQEIAKGNMDLSSRTETQASSLQQTAASMEELTGAVKQNTDSAQQANQLAQSASTTAVKGGEVVAQVVDTMSAINESSKRIVDIIGVINGIAFQTNILALNAAVEAARAGEQGRGFAVVASEVRNLAQRSAAAATEIKGLIDDSVGKVGTGSRLVEQAGLTMSEVVESVKQVADIVSEITAASREQSDGIGQVNIAIAQMDDVTQQNAALVEEAAAAASITADAGDGIGGKRCYF